MKTLKLNALALIAFLAIGISSCSDDDTTTTPVTPPDTTITGLAVATPNLSILVKALKRANLAGTLQGNGSFTAFAPTDDAFNAFFLTLGPNVNVDNVDLPTLTKILLNHVIPSEIKSAAIPASTYVSTLSPFSSAAGAPTISMFVQKVGSNVFINGGTATSGVKVTTPDVDASNGVIHIVNKVIAIPTIVDHVVANPEFDTLQAVVTSATGGAFGDQSAVLGILSGLTGAAPATLFAPNNAALTTATSTGGFAFNATPTQVTKVLQYHATAAGNVRSSALQNNQVVPMITNPVQNTTIILGTGTVDIKDTANNLSRVFQADIQCSNGVIHGVSKVLQPAL